MSTNIKVVRDHFNATSTTGVVYLQFDGSPEWKPFGFSCEDVDRHVEDDPTKKVKGSTAIPIGTYKMVWHTRGDGTQAPMLVDVPGFRFILIHVGNDFEDTEGCLLMGLRRTQTTVSESKKAIDWLYSHLHAKGLGTITVERA